MASQKSRRGFYAGSFDPITNGHVDVLIHALQLVDHLTVAIGVHPSKAPLFTPEERKALIEEACHAAASSAGSVLEIVSFDDLAIDAARRSGATLLLRGLRDGTDFDYEMQMAGMNQAMAPGLQTIFIPASPAVRPITASLVRQIARLGGDVSPFVPAFVQSKLVAKFKTIG